MKQYIFSLVGDWYENGRLSSTAGCYVQVEAETPEKAIEIMEKAIDTVERFKGMRIYEEPTVKEECAPWLFETIIIYDENGNEI